MGFFYGLRVVWAIERSGIGFSDGFGDLAAVGDWAIDFGRLAADFGP